MTFSGCSAATRRIARSCVWKRAGFGEREPQAAQAEVRVDLVRLAHEREWLVGAGVERAHGQRTAVERLRDPRQGFDLLVLRGRVAPVEEEELGAQQPDAFRAVGERLGHVGRAADVREDADPAAVGERHRLVRPRELFGGPLAPGRDGGHGRLVGVALDGARVAVDGDRRPLGELQQRRPEADHDRDPERRGDDRRVIGDAAARGGDRPHHFGVEMRRPRRA